jgi:hypothetical protein
MMKRYLFALGVLALIGLGRQAAYAQETDCDAARCAVQAAIDQHCPCLGVPTGTAAGKKPNHGRYVSCVVHQVNDLAKAGMIPNNCRGRIKRCAARSICGKADFVTCSIPVLGTCDTTTGTCVEDPTIFCMDDTQCAVGTKCKIKHSADLCEMKGGTVGTSPTCCSDCVVSTP